MIKEAETIPNTVQEPPEVKTGRIKSIDVFRGLTIFLMLFVNDVAGVSNIPAWLKHMPAEADGMTFVDVVFPAFLFIVGMSIPFSITKRLKEGVTKSGIFFHILLRTSGLLILGILMVNMGSFNSEAAGFNQQLWIILVFIASIITWNSYPKKSGNEKHLFTLLKLGGGATLIILAVLYKGGSGDSVRWLETSWWGILGLIGWAYFAASVVYLFFRNYPSIIFLSIYIFSLFFVAEKMGFFNSLYEINDSLKIGMQLGSHASVTAAGIFLSLILTSEIFSSLRKKISAMSVYALFLFAAGFLYDPVFGINKNLATPAWCFYSASVCVIIFILIYYLVDYKKHEKWSGFLKPAGSNPLLAYILPSVFYALLTYSGLSFYSAYAEGLVGIIRSLTFTFFILGVTYLLTRLGIKLHL